MLAPVLDPADGAAAFHREPRKRHLLGGKDALVAEAAADVGRNDANLALVEAEALGEARAHDVRYLGGAMDDELLEPAVPMRDHPPALERRHALARRAELARELDGSRPCGRFDVALDSGLEKDVVAPGLVKERGVGTPALQHVVDRGQLLELERHGLRDVLGSGAGVGHAHGDELAHVAHLVGREGRLERDLEAGQAGDGTDRLDARHVRGGEDRIAECLGDLDRPYARMGERAAHEGDLAHAREPDVGDVLPAAGQEALVLLAL